MEHEQYEALNDYGTPGYWKLSYLIAVHSGYLPLHCAATCYVMTYSPRQFNRQFGFWQELPSALKLDPSTRTTTYSDALYFWTSLLSKSTKSIVTLPSVGHDLFKSKKSARGNTSKDGSDFKDQDHNVEHTEKSIDTPIANRGEGTVQNDDSNQDSEANFKCRGCKKRKTFVANTSRVALGDSFFNDI